MNAEDTDAEESILPVGQKPVNEIAEAFKEAQNPPDQKTSVESETPYSSVEAESVDENEKKSEETAEETSEETAEETSDKAPEETSKVTSEETKKTSVETETTYSRYLPIRDIWFTGKRLIS